MNEHWALCVNEMSGKVEMMSQIMDSHENKEIKTNWIESTG